MIFIFCLHLSAQRFDGGVAGGLTASQIDGDTYFGFHKLGIMLGVYTKTQFSLNFGAQFEINYKQKGAAENGTPQNPGIYQLTLHYVEVPLTLNFYFTEDIIFDAGLTAGYLMGAKFIDDDGLVNRDYGLNKGDINWVLGGNYRINSQFSFSVRYAYSILAIRERNTGFYRGLIPELFNIEDGDYNNFLTFAVYYQLTDYE
ncbi:MAG: porin family protein [Bacteroidota bacterium]